MDDVVPSNKKNDFLNEMKNGIYNKQMDILSPAAALKIEEQKMIEDSALEHIMNFLNNLDSCLDGNDENKKIDLFISLRYIIATRTKIVNSSQIIKKLNFLQRYQTVDNLIQKLINIYLTLDTYQFSQMMLAECIRCLQKLIRTYRWFSLAPNINVLEEKVINTLLYYNNYSECLHYQTFKFLKYYLAYFYSRISSSIISNFHFFINATTNYLDIVLRGNLKKNPLIFIVYQIFYHEISSPNFPIHTIFDCLYKYVLNCHTKVIDEDFFKDFEISNYNCKQLENASSHNIKVYDLIADSIIFFNYAFKLKNCSILQLLSDKLLINFLPEFLETSSINLTDAILDYIFCLFDLFDSKLNEIINFHIQDIDASIYISLMKFLRNFNSQKRIKAAKLIHKIINTDKSLLLLFIDNGIEMSNVFNNLNAKYKERMQNLELIQSIIHFYPPGAMFKFDIQRFLKESINFLSNDDNQGLFVIINILIEVYQHLQTIGNESIFKVHFNALNGIEIITQIATVDDEVDENVRNVASAFLKMYCK